MKKNYYSSIPVISVEKKSQPLAELKASLVGLSPNSTKLRNYKDRLVNLTPAQWEASIGLMLGDASLQMAKNGKTCRLKFEWGDKSKPYLMSVYDLFNEWVLSLPHKKERLSPKGNLVTNWGFQTISHKAFMPLTEIFQAKKALDLSILNKEITARSLAYWFMDDGGKLDYNKNSKNNSLVLNTHNFTSLEVENLALILQTKFNLETSVRTNKGKHVIVISHNSYSQFRYLVDTTYHPAMLFKLPKSGGCFDASNWDKPH